MDRYFPRPQIDADGDTVVTSLDFSNASHMFQLPLHTLFKAMEIPRGLAVAGLMPQLQELELGAVVRAQQLWFAAPSELAVDFGDTITTQCATGEAKGSTFRLEVAIFLHKLGGPKVLFARSLAVLIVTKDGNTARAPIPEAMLPLFQPGRVRHPVFQAPLFALPDLARPDIPLDVSAPLLDQLVVARYSDMDSNQHVNQSKYIAWCEDALLGLRSNPPPGSCLAFHEPIASVSVDHCGQAVASDVVRLRGFEDVNGILFEMRKAPNGPVFCRTHFGFLQPRMAPTVNKIGHGRPEAKL